MSNDHEPRPESPERLARQIDYADQIGVNRNTLKQWVRAGMPTVGNRVPVDRANAWRKQHRRRTIAIGRKSRVYFAQRETDGAIKIGFSSDVPRRLIEIRKTAKAKIDLLGTTPGGSADETRLHQRFAHLHIDGEWFQPGDDLLAFVRGLNTPEVQAEMAERDYRFHTLNATQRSALADIIAGKSIARAGYPTRTLQSLMDRRLIRVVGRVRLGLAESAFALCQGVRAAWARWDAQGQNGLHKRSRQEDGARVAGLLKSRDDGAQPEAMAAHPPRFCGGDG